MQNTKISVLGDGGWGTALSLLLSKKGYNVTLWGAFPDYISELRKSRENKKFLPGFTIPDSMVITANAEEALDGAVLAVIAIPSKYLRQTLQKIKEVEIGSTVLASVVKGVEKETFKRPSEIIKEELGSVRIAVLSGPTIANEVAEGLPASSVVASDSEETATLTQEIFMSEAFRVYTGEDVVGVELGGALKNIIAIAAGISDGLGFGSNAKAALFTRGLVEMARIGTALGARLETFSGLSGMGDLVTTCISLYSRNRYVGESIAQGKKLTDILNGMEMVAEGVETTQSVFHLAKQIGVDAPITDQVYKVLFEDKNPLEAVNDLMTRNKKAE